MLFCNKKAVSLKTLFLFVLFCYPKRHIFSALQRVMLQDLPYKMSLPV